MKFNTDIEIDKITIFNTIGQKIMEQGKPVGNFIELKEMNGGIYPSISIFSAHCFKTIHY